MFGLPLELITMLGSTVLGGVMSIWGQSMKMKQEQNKMLLERANANASFVADARNAGKTDKHFAWTRRLIALSACLLYTSPSPRDAHESRMPSSA